MRRVQDGVYSRWVPEAGDLDVAPDLAEVGVRLSVVLGAGLSIVKELSEDETRRLAESLLTARSATLDALRARDAAVTAAIDARQRARERIATAAS